MPSARILGQQAVRELTAYPITSADYGGITGLFTELDVYQIAARGANWRGKDEIRKAEKTIQNLLHALYKSGRLVRYGPVQVPGVPDPDYLRYASRIIYAGAQIAPASVLTPNGVYDRVSAPQSNDPETPVVHGTILDTFARTGRRAGTGRSEDGTGRDDFTRWEDQDDIVTDLAEGDPREIARLRTELEIAQDKLTQALGEVQRLRAHIAQTLTREQVVDAVSRALQRV